MTVKKKQTKGQVKDITLRDVVVHMQHMEQRLTTKIEDVEVQLTSKIDGVDQRLSAKIDGLERRVDRLEVNLTASITALGEDLTVTMEDTYKIRKHVGMAVADNE